MKNYNKLFFSLLLVICINSLSFAQPAETVSAGEIIFNDSFVNSESFNKVYLLRSGENVVIKNLCTSDDVAIGLKSFLDVSNRLALVYQRRDSLSLKIITEYEKIDKTIGNVSLGLTMISDSLRKVSDLNLQPSILLLDDSNKKLESSNKQLDDAVLKLDEINSDLNKIQISNIWKYLGFALGGVAVGVLIGGLAF